MYSKNYEEIGDRIQCYTDVVSYTIDTLARNKDISFNGFESAS
jgi:hypothetical protein